MLGSSPLRPAYAIARLVLCFVVLAGVQAACNRASEETAGAPHPRMARKKADDSIPGPDVLEAELFGVAPAGTFGPYLGVSRKAAIAMWAEASAEGGEWYTASLGTGAEPLRIASAPADIGLAAIRPAAGEGFFAIASSADGAGSRVDALRLGNEGELRGGPVPLARGLGDLVWLEVVSTSAGTLAMWAIHEGDGATIYAQPLGKNAQALATPRPVLQEAMSWQAVDAGSSAALAVVVPAAGEARGGNVRVVYVGVDGSKESEIDVHSAGTAENDLDMVALGDRLLLAWSDRSAVQAHATIAVIGGDGKLVEPPRSAVPALGDQAVIQLLAAPGSQRAYLAFEDLAAARPNHRDVRIVPVSRDGRVGSRGGVVHFSGERMPELSVTPGGIAALTLAKPCPRGERCDHAAVPTFVELSVDFAVLAAEPLRLDVLDGAFAELAWGLSCASGECFTMVAQSTAPAAMWTVPLHRRSDAWEPAASAYQVPPPPRAKAAVTVAATQPLADVAVTRTSAGPLAAWVTYFDPSIPYEKPKTPAPDGRLAPVRAVLSVQNLAKEGAQPSIVSYRARSLGGVALASEGATADRALLVWSALDANQPQLFVTLVDGNGEKITQKMLTRANGEVNDAAATFVGDGWILAWVDERLGYPEVFVTKLDERLNRVAPDTRLSKSPGSATGVAVLALDDTVLVARADARGHDEGLAEIYVAEVSKKNAKVVEEELRLTTNATHSHSPKLSRLGSRVIVGWLESTPRKSAGTFTGSVSLGVYAPDLRQLESVAELKGDEDVAPTSVALECGATECHVMMLVETSGNAEFHGFTWSPEDSPKIVRVLRLMGRPTDVVAPDISGDVMLFADATRDGEGRVRKATIEWR